MFGLRVYIFSLHVLKEQLKLQQSCIEQNNQIETELTMKDEELCEKLEKIQKTQQTIELRYFI